mmetsp:Transcript_965/g.2220  ORF Transcript_965/g.2220 Transcript_965/m.2220 type:complete len:226 (+) Transcript_965:342-1019(+)
MAWLPLRSARRKTSSAALTSPPSACIARRSSSSSIEPLPSRSYVSKAARSSALASSLSCDGSSAAAAMWCDAALGVCATSAAARMAARHVARCWLNALSCTSEPGRGVAAAWPQTHGEESSWSAVVRCDGSGWRRPQMTSRAPAETWRQHSSVKSTLCASTFATRASSSALPSGSKGWKPERRMYRITPTAHRSTSGPYGRPLSCSGAMYPTVPLRPSIGGGPSP